MFGPLGAAAAGAAPVDRAQCAAAAVEVPPSAVVARRTWTHALAAADVVAGPDEAACGTADDMIVNAFWHVSEQ
jgi:hypothetical protein